MLRWIGSRVVVVLVGGVLVVILVLSALVGLL